MEYQVLIREPSGEQKWLPVSEVFRIARRYKKPTPTPVGTLVGFQEWWDLYSYKKQRKKALTAWNNNVKEKLIPKIMEHTRRYVKQTSGEKKRYRQYPTTYLNGHTWEDEIIKEEKTYDLKEYPRDKTGFPRAWCSKCGNIDTYYEWEINKGSKCCNSTDKKKVVLLPFDPKTNKGKYD
jgi:hypothetical protein|tara:strand:- start:184 stop:720 length:537 start_codon:yes stop_codon:yes gene_type:complete